MVRQYRQMRVTTIHECESDVANSGLTRSGEEVKEFMVILEGVENGP